jgi:hypothetical protein
MAVAIRGTQIGDAQLLFQAARPANQFAKYRTQTRGRERAFACRGSALEDLLFPGWVINHFPGGVFQLTDLKSQLSPIVHHLNQFAVDPIDLGA